MKTWVRAVRLRADTDQGPVGRSVVFAPGLCVVCGANSRGKTQIVQSLIYGLGLERMLRTRANTPLGSAMTSEVIVEEDAGETTRSITESWVAVELENEQGKVLTAQRYVKHATRQPNLVRVWEGPALTDWGAAGEPADYFLHAPGSAQRERGFHTLLADFFGWQLPRVANYSGELVTLYLDVIFPFLVVDQLSWGSAGPRKVDRYQIRDPVRRSVEFLLALEGPATRARRNELERALVDLRTTWASNRGALEAAVSTVGARVVGIPEYPVGAQARKGSVTATDLSDARLEVLEDGEWQPADDVVAHVAQDLTDLTAAAERTIPEGVDESARAEHEQARAELGDLLAAARLLEQEVSMSEAQLAALDRRVDALQEEHDRNSDVRTLRRLGSQAAAHHLADHNCPTCRQSLDAVEGADLGPVLDLDDTIGLLNAQLATARSMRDRARLVVEQSSSAYAALQRQTDTVRARIRALDADLLAPADTPSSGDIARRVTVELRRDELDRVQQVFTDRIGTLSEASQQVAQARTALNALPEGQPPEDLARLEQVADLMRQHLTDSHFGSYAVSEVRLDMDTLRPAREGFDVDTDASASDVVRIKVAYLEAVRAVAQAVGPHPGLLALDEPRQQDIAEADFGAMLRYLAQGSAETGQVIVASATPRGELEALLRGTPATISDLGDARLLQPEEAADPMDI